MRVHDPTYQAVAMHQHRLAQVHISGGFEDMARQLTRDRFLLGVVDTPEDDHVPGRAILIPANRIDYVVDVND